MAEGFARHYGSDVLEVYSAGTRPSEKVDANAIEVMKEAGIDISGQRPKTLDEIPYELDVLIKMGCGIECPFVISRHSEDWGLPDPAGHPIEEFRRVRDIIKEKVEALIDKARKTG